MKQAHVNLQFDRLQRHYESSLRNRDAISYLDLTHSLRIWVDMCGAVTALAKTAGVKAEFPTFSTSSSAKDVLRGSRYIYLPIAGGVDSPGIQIKGLRITNRALSADEVMALYLAGPPKIEKKTIDFKAWLGCGVYQVPSESPRHPSLQISRKILIKRVANLLGASHPEGMDQEEADKKFDPYVRDLHQLLIADGYPATYYQMLEFAKDILAGFSALRSASGEPNEQP